MRAWQTMCVLTGSLVAGSAHSMTVTDYKSRKAEKNITFYIAGVGAGFYYTMNTAKAMGQSRLYCPASGPARDDFVVTIRKFCQDEAIYGPFMPKVISIQPRV